MISNQALKITIEALKLSSDYVINFYNKKINYIEKTKFSRDIVSDVDINSEKIILNHLIKKFNKHNFILEEREKAFKQRHSKKMPTGKAVTIARKKKKKKNK